MTGAGLVWLALTVQAAATVGDTVWVGMTARAPARMIIRPQTWDLGDLGRVLGSPDVTYGGDSVTVRYPVAFWYAGRHTVSVPGPIVVSPEGASDTLPSSRVTVQVASVLPPDSARSRLEPRGPAGTVPRDSRSLLPVTVFGLVAGLGVGGLWLLRRRRLRHRRAAVPEPAAERPDPVATLEAWARAGELRAALDGWSHLIERANARTADPTTGDRVAAWVDAADRIGFQPEARRADVERLIADARPLLELAERRARQ